jgi:hypothetical protein
VGFTADGANVKIGDNYSLSTLLINEVPNLFILKCICHSFVFCDSYACKKLPNSIENLVREIYFNCCCKSCIRAVECTSIIFYCRNSSCPFFGI